ncbi:hypothetical protein ACIBQ0_17620 [Nocardia nova]|uniref:hypothetical protein n=1 Tax=Nocardia nova TaxID=37330 RepID=UPI0037B874A6
MPTYYWGTAPAEAGQTVRQLRALGLRPKNRSEYSGQVLRPRANGREPLTAYLYTEAVPKSPATPAQLAAVARATRARQERAMQRHGIDPAEAERDEPDWGERWGWEGFSR